VKSRSVATQGSRNEFDLSYQTNVTFFREGAPSLEDATFLWESYCDSLRDPASAQVPRAFACSNACSFSRPAKVRLRSPHTALSAQDDA